MKFRPDIESRGRLRPGRRFRIWDAVDTVRAAGAAIYPLAAGIERFRRDRAARTPPSPPRSMSRSRSRSRGRSSSRMRSVSFRRGSRSRSRSSSLTTEQRDSGTRYSGSRRQSRRGRQVRQFARRVRNAVLSMGNTQTLTYTRNTQTTSAVNQQNWHGQMIGSTLPGNNSDLLRVFQAAYGAALAKDATDDYRLFIKSICLDMQMYNTGTKTAIIEFYYISCRKPWFGEKHIDEQFKESFAEIPSQTGFANAVTNVGYSAFQNSLFCQYWKIDKKVQVQLGPNETTTLQIRLGPKWVNGKILETCQSSIKNYTKAILFAVKGAPGMPAGSAGIEATELTWTCQTTINYQIPPSTSRLALATQ